MFGILSGLFGGARKSATESWTTETDPILTATSDITGHDEKSVDDYLEGNIYVVDGPSATLMVENGRIRHCQLTTTAGLTESVIEVVDQENLRYEWLADNILSIRQFRPNTVQFLVKDKAEATEYGIHFASGQEASLFRAILLDAISESTLKVATLTALADIYDHRNEDYRLWLSSCAVTLSRRATSDALALLTLSVLDDDDQYAVILRTELSNDIQLACSLEKLELTFWGTYSQLNRDEGGEGWSRTLIRIRLQGELAADFISAVMRCVGFEAKLIEQAEGIFAGLEEIGCDQSPSEGPDTESSAFEWQRMEQQSKKYQEDSDVSPKSNSSESEESASSEEEPPEPSPPRRQKPGRISISYDPSGDIKRANPKAKLHRFMHVGDQYGLVCRGQNDDFCLDVYHNNSQWKDGASIGNEKFYYNGKKISPLNAVLQDGETKLIMADRESRNEVYQMDLERETVVAKYQTNGLDANLLWNTTKGGSMSHDPTLMGANKQAYFMLDTRQTRGVNAKEYKTAMNFLAAASDEKGHVVLANDRGEFRLYDGGCNDSGNLKIAKTQLDSFKEKVTAVDVTRDGSWVLGTMRSCLVLFPTKLKSSGLTGFETRLGQNKPPAIKLQLKHQDIAKWALQTVDFRAAVFDRTESYILTSTGNLAVVWDFRQIKRGKTDIYKIRVLADFIKEAQTLPDSSVVVAYPEQVQLVDTKGKL